MDSSGVHFIAHLLVTTWDWKKFVSFLLHRALTGRMKRSIGNRSNTRLLTRLHFYLDIRVLSLSCVWSDYFFSMERWAHPEFMLFYSSLVLWHTMHERWGHSDVDRLFEWSDAPEIHSRRAWSSKEGFNGIHSSNVTHLWLNYRHISILL